MTLIPRVIPCLLIDSGMMVKTRRFQSPNYVGDAVNVISLFNNFEVDEISLLDISATRQGREPDIDLIESIADECWVPLSYGGGITTTKQIERIVRAGVEKVVIGTAVAENLGLITEAAREFGSQAIVGSIDVQRKMFNRFEVRVLNGTRRLSMTPAERARMLEEAGAGEILLQSIDRDGQMSGYDIDMISEVTASTNLPVIACGGAGSREDLPQPVFKGGSSASGAASIFVYQGASRGVLINFPERAELAELFKGRA